jgi:hypothetical protein
MVIASFQILFVTYIPKTIWKVEILKNYLILFGFLKKCKLHETKTNQEKMNKIMSPKFILNAPTSF